ncbi:hypothetical protein [Spirosoma lituiforme]
MNRVYEFAMRLKDLVSPQLARINATVSRTASTVQQATSRMQSGFARAGQSVEQLRRRLTFGREIQNIDTLNRHLDGLTRRRDISVDTREIRQLNREIGQAEREMQRLQRLGGGGTGGAVGGGISGMLAGSVGGMLTTAALVAGAGAMLQQGIGREQTQMAYEQFTRDPAIARDLIAKQNRFADVTPFTNEEVMGAGRSMLSYGFKANDIVHQESMVGDVAAGVQTNFGELAGVYGKLKSKGFADTSDIWQFADRGIPILDALSKSLGKSKEEILKMAETRQIKFTDIEKAFESMTSKGGMFEGMLDKMSKTTGGKLSTLMGTVQNKIGMLAESLNPIISLLLEVGSGLFAALDPVFNAIMNLFKAFEPLFIAIGKLLELFGIGGQQAGLLTVIMQLLATAINGVAWVVNLLSTAIQYLVENPILLFIASATLIILNLATITGWLVTLIGWIGTAFAWVVALAESFWAFSAAMLACPAVWIVAAIAAIVAGIMWLWDNVEGFRHALIKLWEVAKSVFGSIGKAWNALMKGDFSGVGKAFADGIKQGLANADVKIKADKASRAAANVPKVPNAPAAKKPAMPKAPGVGGPGAPGGGDGKPGGKGKDKEGIGKSAGLEATTGGTKSTTITINLKSLVERININAGSVGEGVKDMEAQVTDAMLRVLNSSNSMATQ